MLPNRTLILALTILAAILCIAYTTVVQAQAQIDNVNITVTQPPPSEVYQNQKIAVGLNITNNNPYNVTLILKLTANNTTLNETTVQVSNGTSINYTLTAYMPNTPGKYNVTLYANNTRVDSWLITVKKILLNVTVTPIGYLVVKGVHGSEVCFDVKANSTVAGTYDVYITVPSNLTIVDYKFDVINSANKPEPTVRAYEGRVLEIVGLQTGQEVRICPIIKLNKGSRPGFYNIIVYTYAPYYEEFDYPVLVVNESKSYSININVEPKYGKYYANYTITANIRAEAYPRVQTIPDIIVYVAGPNEAYREVRISWSKYAPKVNVELKVLAKDKYVKPTPTPAVYNYTDFLLSESKTVSVLVIGKENAEVLEEWPNVTIIVTVSDELGLKASSTIYRVLDFRGPKIVKFEVKPAVNVNGVYWIRKDVEKIDVNITIDTFVSLPYTAKITTFELYINDTSRPVTCTRVLSKVIDESGKNITVVLCTFDVEKEKLLFNVGLKVCDSADRCVWVNETGPLKIKRDIVPPSPVKFNISLLNYIFDISASDKETGVAGYNITIVGSSKLSVIVPVEYLEKKYTVFYSGGSVDLSDLMSISAVDRSEVWKKILDNGAIIVGYGRVYIIPPGLETKTKVIIRAVDYSGNQGPETTITISYNSSVKPDTFAIIYIDNGWNMFAVPGLLDDAGRRMFKTFIEHLKNVSKIVSYCVKTGVLSTFEPCTEYVENPVIFKTASEIVPIIFLIHVEKLREPELLVLPVYFKTLTEPPMPVMITAEVKPGMWTVAPVTLNYKIIAPVNETLHLAVQMDLAVYAYDPIRHEFKLVGVKYSGESRFAESMYVPSSTLMLLSSTVGGVVSITPVFYPT